MPLPHVPAILGLGIGTLVLASNDACKVQCFNRISPFFFGLFQDVVKDFERNISDMVANFIEAAQGIYPCITIHRPGVCCALLTAALLAAV